MKREIKIFKNFKEQEEYHLKILQATTPMQRLKWLYQMQQLTLQMHDFPKGERKIIIHKNGYTQ